MRAASIAIACAVISGQTFSTVLLTGQTPPPTTPVIFEFTSRQFVFESGKAMLFRLTEGPSGGLMTMAGRWFDFPEIGRGGVSIQEWNIRDGATPAVPVNAPGAFKAVLGRLKAVRKNNQREFEMMNIAIRGDVTDEALRAGRATIRVDIPQIVTIRVEDSTGQAVPNARVSMSNMEMESGTSELFSNEKGELTLLGVVGRYFVSIASVGDRQVDGGKFSEFEIVPTDSGERVVVLRVP